MEEALKVVCGSLCIFALLVAAALLLYLNYRDRKIVRTGETFFAAIVQANSELFISGDEDLPAQVLLSPDVTTAESRRDLLQIAKRMAEFKTREPQNGDEEHVAELVRDERPHWGRRERLPSGFTGGLTVYVVTISVVRKYLPSNRIEPTYIICRAIPGTEGDAVMIPYDQFDP